MIYGWSWGEISLLFKNPTRPFRGTEEEVLRKIATVHLELLFIHPYREGNGRTARLVATLMALQAGYNGFNWEIAEARFADYIKAIQTLSLELMMSILRQALRHWSGRFVPFLENSLSSFNSPYLRSRDYFLKKHLPATFICLQFRMGLWQRTAYSHKCNIYLSRHSVYVFELFHKHRNTTRPCLTREHGKKATPFCIWRLDRLGRSLRNVIDIVEQLQKRGVGFRSINDGGIDTTKASGEICATLKISQASYSRYLGL